MPRRRTNADDSTVSIGFEANLWSAADLLRGNIEPGEYKHVLLGLIFLKYVSDAFEERRAELLKEQGSEVDLDNPQAYPAHAVCYLPPKARWSFLRARATQPNIGTLINQAMKAIEDSNPTQLRGVLPCDYARPALDKGRLGQVIELLSEVGIGGKGQQARDTLGRVYEYCLSQFASAEGRRGGDYYTPPCVVRLLVEMLEPRPGTRIYDPCCGSGGLFVQSERFIATHGGRRGSVSVFGQEYNHTTWKLCRMNLAIRGIEADIREGDSFHTDRHPDLKADFVLANPPFNMSEWGGRKLHEDPRWQYGSPPPGNANYAWIQHILSHLAPDGCAGVVLANGALSSNQQAEAAIRRRLIEADLVDCIVYLPPQLFYSTQIAVSLWFLVQNKVARDRRDRRGQTLFIYAYPMGTMTDRTHRQLSDAEVDKIAAAYRAWKGAGPKRPYRDIPGFCRSASLEEIRQHRLCLVPGRYVGFAPDAVSELDKSELREELQAIRQRLQAVHDASANALNVLEQLCDG